MPRGTVPTVGELEARIDEAVVIARASEDGVREVGEMAVDAAKQARRAAEMAEQSARSAAASREAAALAARPAGPVSDAAPSPTGVGSASSPPAGSGGEKQPSGVKGQPTREVVIDPLQRFNARADALAARLKKLERVSL